MDKIKQLKLNIRERQVPFFDDEELQYYLDKNGENVEKASYECLIIKAETTGITVSGLTTNDTSSYFRKLASNYVTTNSGKI